MIFFQITPQGKEGSEDAPLYYQIHRERDQICRVVDSAKPLWKDILLLSEADYNLKATAATVTFKTLFRPATPRFLSRWKSITFINVNGATTRDSSTTRAYLMISTSGSIVGSRLNWFSHENLHSFHNLCKHVF